MFEKPFPILFFSKFLDEIDARFFLASQNHVENQAIINLKNWHQTCLLYRQNKAEVCINSITCNVQTTWLGRKGRESGGSSSWPPHPIASTGRLGTRSWALSGKVGSYGGSSQPTGRHRPMGRMAGRLEKTGGPVKTWGAR